MVESTKRLSAKKMLSMAALVMLVVFGSMFYIYFESSRLADKHDPLLLAAMNIRMEVTLAHLRFEGLVNHDPDEGVDPIWKHLDEAEGHAQAMLNGGIHAKTTYIATQDSALRSNIIDVLSRLSELRKVVTAWQQQVAITGPSPEQHFDMIYAVLMQGSNAIENRLQQKIQVEQGSSQRVQIGLAMFSFLVGLFIVITFARYIRRINANIEELQSAYEELEHSNRDLASFAYIASHDLREPLRKIQAFGDRLISKESDNLSPRGQDYIVRMQKAALRMKDLIEALLNYSRIGTKGEALVATDLNTVMQDVLDDLEYSIKESGAEIKISQLPVIDADKTQIRQVFQNLIANALKFQRPDVKPLMRISAIVDKGLCTLTFSDNGIGFEPEYAERIFGVFQRLHGRDAYEGTGIGLSICQKTAERHGGHITAVGRPGEGATFTLTLPVKQKEEI
jgi:signal transduction histidine kinase